VLRFMETYFDQPLDVKMKDDRTSVTHGSIVRVILTMSGITDACTLVINLSEHSLVLLRTRGIVMKRSRYFSHLFLTTLHN
jgi:hypothetical protein